jgi:glycosyltransferase involved in cell wall biosynthesis
VKVLQVAHSVYPLSQAGTEIYTAELARALTIREVEVRVAIPSYAADKAPPSAVERLPDYVRVIPMSPGGWWGNKVRALTLRGPLWQDGLRRLARSFRPDVVHVQHADGFGVAALRVLGDEEVPMVVTLPDYWLLCEGILRRCGGDRWKCAGQCLPSPPRSALGRLAGFGRVWIRQWRVRRFIRRYRPTLAAISESTRRTFQRAGFPAELLVTRPWGIDDSVFRGRRTAAPDTNGVPRIGYLGSLRPHKGCHVLLEAFKRLPGQAELHFFGSGDERYISALRDDSKGLRVTFHGRFDHADVADILAAVDVVVIPSTWEETYCLVFQEAMAARRPVVASAVGGLSDRVVEGVNGFLVPPGEPGALSAKLGWLLEHLPETREKLDYDRCRLTIGQDAEEWMGLFEATVRRRRGETGLVPVRPARDRAADPASPATT